MITPTAVAVALLLATGPQQEPQAHASPAHAVAGSDFTEPDGSRGRWASVEYELPTGEQAELAITITEAGDSVTGDGWLSVSGELIADITLAADGTLSTASRSRVSSDATAAALAGITPDIAENLALMLVPESEWFACSEFGKKAVRAGKYMMIGAIAATVAACCGVTGPACAVCGVGGAGAYSATTDAFNDYCD